MISSFHIITNSLGRRTSTYELDDRAVGDRVPVGIRLSFLYVVLTGSGTHTASLPMDTGGFFPGGKAAGAWNWPLTPTTAKEQEYMDLYIHSPIRFHGVVLN
jgi:hypothetical protein